MEKILAVASEFIGNLFELIKSWINYLIGKRTKIDDIKLKEVPSIAKRVSVLFQNVMDDDQYYFNFYHSDAFKYIKNIEDFSRHFENQRGSFYGEYHRIDELIKTREKLKVQLKTARLYLNYDIIEDIQTYLKLDQFWYETTAYTDNNTFYLEFFRNISDDKNHAMRGKISHRVLKKLGRLINL